MTPAARYDAIGHGYAEHDLAPIAADTNAPLRIVAMLTAMVLRLSRSDSG